MENINKITDCLVFGAHPDDAEICAGGAIAKLTKEDKNVVIVDLTRGEMGTRGNEEIRAREAAEAAKILGVKERLNLGMVDGFISISEENLYKIVQVIRRYRPNMIMFSPSFERHPDHENSHQLIRNAMFKSGLTKFVTEFDGKIQETFRTRKMYCYMHAYQYPRYPDFYVDISDVQEQKMEAIRAFGSQVHTGKYENEPKTRLSSPEFLEELVARSRYFGGLCGVNYAEAFLTIEPLKISSLSKLL